MRMIWMICWMSDGARWKGRGEARGEGRGRLMEMEEGDGLTLWSQGEQV